MIAYLDSTNTHELLLPDRHLPGLPRSPDSWRWAWFRSQELRRTVRVTSKSLARSCPEGQLSSPVPSYSRVQPRLLCAQRGQDRPGGGRFIQCIEMDPRRAALQEVCA